MQPNLKDLVANRIRELVLSGQLRPGQKIDQDQLARDLEISKLPVREALIVLEGDGLIDNKARRGAFVAPLTREDVRDHYAIYGLLSGHGARRAAETLDPDALDALEEMIDKMESTDSATESEHLNFTFHRTINRAGGSRRLLSALRLFSKTIPARFYEFTADWKPRAIDDHRRILAALRSRDGDEVARLVNLHLQTSGEYAVRMLEEAGFWDEESPSD